jgi:hypothetical protein
MTNLDSNMFILKDLQGICKEAYYAKISTEGSRVTIHCASTDLALDDFTLSEYAEMLDEGVCDKSTGKLTINW